MKTFKTVTTQALTTLVCDGCGLQASANADYEFHEFVSVNQRCGYGSIHGDGKQINIDLCQQCFADMCGNSLRVSDDSNSVTENNVISETNSLKYNNIFEVICQSKNKALQLKDSCDLRLTAREILSKNKIADLICAYEKKDWSSYFEEAPLADDDFMPGRLNFKSKFSCDEEQTASGMLSSIPNKHEIDDEASRDSALAESHLDDAKQHLIESIVNVMAKYPELRLGQLLVNAMTLEQPCPELFYIEDDELVKRLNQQDSE